MKHRFSRHPSTSARYVLAVKYRGPVHLKLEEVFSTRKNYVVRCRVLEPSSGNNQGTVIV